MAAGILEVDIVARMDKLQKGLDKAEQEMKKTGDTIDKSLGSGGAKAAMAMGKVFAVMGAIEGGAKAISAATEITRGIFAGLAGDSEEFQRSMGKAEELLLSLPFGIGPVVQGIKDMILSMGGFNKSLKEAEEIMAKGKLASGFHDATMAIHRSNKLLASQRDILLEQDVLKKAEMQLAADIAALERETLAVVEEIRANEEMDAVNKKFRLKRMREEFDLRKEMLEIEHRQFREAELARRAEEVGQGILNALAEGGKKIEAERKRIAEERKKAEQELAKQRKEEIKQLEAANKVEGERLGKINARLGMMSTAGASAKSGFTQTGSTALGAFTFAEAGAKDVMASLTKEAKDIQSRIDGTAKRIEEILKQLATKIGFA